MARRAAARPLSYAMPLRFLKLAMKARELPEARILGRVVVGLVGAYVLWPVASSLREPMALAPTDLLGLVVFTGVGGWLVVLAIRGWG